MAYIGNQVSSVPFIIDTFSGTGSASVFGQLTRAPAGVASIAVFVAGVYKTPGVDYTLNGDLILFTTPPAAGTDNIVIHHMGNGSATQVPSDGSVTGAKLSSNVVRSNNIVAGTITSNLIAVGAITGNLIPARAISPNHIVTNSITGNLIGLNAISGNQIGISAITSNLINVGAVTGNTIGVFAVSGNQIGLGAISSNHFAGGGVTSDVLSSNLTISTARVAETVNVVTSAVGGNYEIHIANSTVYHFLANTSANVTFQFIANTGRSVDTMLSIGQSASIAIMMKQGSTRYRANIHIDGVHQTAYWAGNAQPQYVSSGGAQPMSYDAYTFSIMKIAAGQYTVFASNTNFGQANGQGMSTINNGFGPIQ
jgi:hypothetical protein